MMKKYNIYQNNMELNLNDIQEGCTFMAVDTDPELLKSFDAKEQAMEFLKTKETTATKVRCNLFAVAEYYLTEEEWNEDLEEFQPGDMIAASDVFQAKLSAMREVGKIPYIADGEACDRSELMDGKELTDGSAIFFPVTEEEGLMYEYTVIEKDENDSSHDLIKINSVKRLKNM